MLAIFQLFSMILYNAMQIFFFLKNHKLALFKSLYKPIKNIQNDNDKNTFFTARLL